MTEFGHDTQITATDPVCGEELPVEKAAAQENYRGWAYFFCSVACRDTFRVAPNRYLQHTAPHGAAALEHGD